MLAPGIHAGDGDQGPSYHSYPGLGGAACPLLRSLEGSWSASIALFPWLGQTTYPPVFGVIYAFIGITSKVGWSLGPLSPSLKNRGGWEPSSAKVGLTIPKRIPRDAGS